MKTENWDTRVTGMSEPINKNAISTNRNFYRVYRVLLIPLEQDIPHLQSRALGLGGPISKMSNYRRNSDRTLLAALEL